MLAIRSKSGPEDPESPEPFGGEEEEIEWTDVDELDMEMGQAWRAWFDLYKKGLIGFLTAGSHEKTGELTMWLRPIGEEKDFCTSDEYDEVARLFIDKLNKIIEGVKEKVKKLP